MPATPPELQQPLLHAATKSFRWLTAHRFKRTSSPHLSISTLFSCRNNTNSLLSSWPLPAISQASHRPPHQYWDICFLPPSPRAPHLSPNSLCCQAPPTLLSQGSSTWKQFLLCIKLYNLPLPRLSAVPRSETPPVAPVCLCWYLRSM